MAGNRCPNCETFVSLETGEPEENNIEVSDSGESLAEVTAEFTVPRNCSDCGDTAKTAEYSLEGGVELEHAADCDPEKRELSVEVDSMEASDELRTMDRHGKPIKKSRYQRLDIVLSVDATVKCSCGVEATCSMRDSVNAGSFDEQW